MIRKVIILAAFIASVYGALAQNEKLDDIKNLQEFVKLAKKGKWKQAKQQNGISINYRDLVLFDNIETREMSVKFKLTSSSIDSILANIKQPNNIKRWNESVKDAKLLKSNDSNWIIHTIYKIPFPFAQQDLVASYSLERKNDTLLLFSKSFPNYIKPKKGITREGYNLSKWSIITTDTESFEIEFSVISLSNSNIPRFIKDPIIQRKLLSSFIKLKENLL